MWGSHAPAGIIYFGGNLPGKMCEAVSYFHSQIWLHSGAVSWPSIHSKSSAQVQTCPNLCPAVEKVYPIGIPVLYFLVLWKRRHLLNPRVYSAGQEEGGGASDDTTGASFVSKKDDPSAILLTASNGQTKAYWPPEELEELDQRVKARTEHPDLSPFVFLWGDFGEGQGIVQG